MYASTQPDPEFWRGKRVFVTGHTGFKGSWLCLWLQYLGAQVTGYALPAPTEPSLYHDAQVARGMASIQGDICDLASLQRAMALAQPTIVIHLAAQSLVRDSYQNPVATYATNVMGTVNLLEAVRHTPTVRAVVNVTSDACYENREWHWGYRETDALGGYDPHSASKTCAEMVTTTYRNAFFNPLDYSNHGVALATARSGNGIGGGDWAAHRLVPDLLKALLQGQSAVIRNPHATRPWQHVLEPLQGYLLLSERLYRDGMEYGEAWNFGSNENQMESVGWVADQIYHLWGSPKTWRRDEQVQDLHESHFLKLDSSKAHHRLGWQPVLDLKTTLRWTVEWTQRYRAGADMRSLTLHQIRHFMAIAQPQDKPRTLADAAQDPEMMRRLHFCC